MTRKHTCHAAGCEVITQPRMLMCARHWRMVPKHIQRRVYAHYQPGQEEGEHTPTEAWHEAANEAIAYVRQLESESP